MRLGLRGQLARGDTTTSRSKGANLRDEQGHLLPGLLQEAAIPSASWTHRSPHPDSCATGCSP